MIKKVSHVGVIVDNLDEALKLYENLFNLKPAAVKEIMDGKIRIAFIPVGDDEIELISPIDPSIPVGGLPQTRGIHHVSFVTDDIESEVERLKKLGVLFTAETPKIGAHGVKIIFTKPETTGGVTIELCQES
ncbi:MAG: VOC family protein [Candidatus Bathyarchaeia archaeon]